MTHEQIRQTLAQYKRELGAGKMVPAANTIGRLVAAMADILLANGLIEAGAEEVPAPAPVAKPVETKFEIEIGGLPIEDAKKFLAEQMTKVTDAHTAAVEAAQPSPAVLRDMPSDPPEVSASPEPCAPCDVSIPNNPDLIDEFKEPVVPVEAAAEEPATEKVTAAPAPKTQKPKAST